jgi:DNA-binding transcriptional regulator GbsR (MarR family)
MSLPNRAIAATGPAVGLVLAEGRPAGIVAFEAALVGFFVDAADLVGVPKSVAAIYGVIFASPQPLSFAEIGSRLKLSKGSVSQGLRILREVGAVSEVSAAADRAAQFAPDLELRKLIGRFLENRLQKQLDTSRNRLQDLKVSAAAFPSPARKEMLRRVKKLQQWNDRSRALVPVVKGFLHLTSV